MKVYYGTKGNSFYIMCIGGGFREIYKFDMFGNLEAIDCSIESCNNWVEVDYLSYVGVSAKESEIMYNGIKAYLDIPLLEAIAPIRKYGKFLGTMFNVPHSDDFGRFNQILFIFDKGVITKDIVDKQYPDRVWRPLQS